jgi:hypothetical protein
MKNEYSFDDKNHIHVLDDKPLHGVTTVLGVISKPFLIQWSANMAVDYIQNEVARIATENTGFDMLIELGNKWPDVLKEARSAHRKKKEKAGDWGTIMHDSIEKWIKAQTLPKLTGELKVGFNKFRDWAKENKVEFIESEKHVWSRELWIGGILDLVFKMDGKKYIGDIKTAGAIYNEAFFQMGAYDLCLKEMGEAEDIEGYMVINLKKDGTIDFKLADNMQINRDAFKYALGLYKIINSLK